jgi:predicted transcriptional regulator
MRCVWDLGTANAAQVSVHLRERYGREDLSPRTVGIFLARLVEKGYLGYRLGLVPPGGGRAPHLYSPRVCFETALRLAVDRFLADYRIDGETLAEVLVEAEKKEPPQATKRARVRRG